MSKQHQVSIEEMERESILKTKESLFKLGMDKVKRENEEIKKLEKYNKAVDYVFTDNNLKMDSFYDEMRNFRKNEWKNLINSFSINTIFNNTEDTIKFLKRFYYLLHCFIIKNNQLQKDYEELEVHKNDIDDEYEECIKSLDTCEKNMKEIVNEKNKMKKHNDKVLNSFNKLKFVLFLLLSFIFFEHFSFFRNILYVYYTYFTFYIGGLIWYSDYEFLNLSGFIVHHYLIHKLYQFTAFHMFLKYNKNIFISNFFVDLLNPQ